MAPAKAVAAGWVCIALTHTLWQRLHRQFGLAFQLRMSESIVHVRDLHAQCYGAMMDARWHNRYHMVEMMPRLCTARCHCLC